MIRKQIYLTQRQVTSLKRLAKRRGISEAEVVRQALEREVAAEEIWTDNSSAAALNELMKSALERREHGQTGDAYQWRRDDAYEERLGRYSKDGIGDVPQS